MADQKQLEILRQGKYVWNEWRERNFSERINLDNVDLCGLAYLNDVNFSKAILNNAFLSEANLYGADLSEANLTKADLTKANLTEADLRYTNLSRTNLSGANLIGAKFSNAEMGMTVLTNVNLNETTGLEKVIHWTASILGIDTMQLSKGKIPEAFLRGCGLSDWEIESAKLYDPDLNNDKFLDIQNKIFDLRQRQALQISPLFISYSHTDSEFVDKLEDYLNEKGVRFWRDKHDATAGRLEKQIDRAIRQNPTVLLILSENSIKSDWVQHEVREAREMEKDIGRDVLCPIALDKSWKTSPWPKRVMEQVMEYNILDFSIWEDNDKFKNVFGKLIDGLNLYYKK